MKRKGCIHMKKLATMAMAILAAACMAVSVSAADFTPSVTGKEAPDVVPVQTEDGKDAVALIKDKDGKEVQGVTTDNLLVTPLAKADNAPADVAQQLNAAYDQIKGAATLDKLVPDISKVLEKLPGKPAVGDLVVRDLFDVKLGDAEKALLKDGAYVEIRFKVGIAKDAAIVCLHNVSGTEWEVIDPSRVVNNGDGTVTVSFNSLSPIAFAVQTSGGSTTKPSDKPVGPAETGERGISPAVLWVGAAALVVVAGIAAFEVKKSRSKKTVK